MPQSSNATTPRRVDTMMAAICPRFSVVPSSAEEKDGLSPEGVLLCAKADVVVVSERAVFAEA